MGLSDIFSLSKILAKTRDWLNGRKFLISSLLGLIAGLRVFGKNHPEYPWFEALADTLDYALNAIHVGADINLSAAAGFGIWGLIDRIRKVGTKV